MRSLYDSTIVTLVVLVIASGAHSKQKSWPTHWAECRNLQLLHQSDPRRGLSYPDSSKHNLLVAMVSARTRSTGSNDVDAAKCLKLQTAIVENPSSILEPILSSDQYYSDLVPNLKLRCSAEFEPHWFDYPWGAHLGFEAFRVYQPYPVDMPDLFFLMWDGMVDKRAWMRVGADKSKIAMTERFGGTAGSIVDVTTCGAQPVKTNSVRGSCLTSFIGCPSKFGVEETVLANIGGRVYMFHFRETVGAADDEARGVSMWIYEIPKRRVRLVTHSGQNPVCMLSSS